MSCDKLVPHDMRHRIDLLFNDQIRDKCDPDRNGPYQCLFLPDKTLYKSMEFGQEKVSAFTCVDGARSPHKWIQDGTWFGESPVWVDRLRMKVGIVVPMLEVFLI